MPGGARASSGAAKGVQGTGRQGRESLQGVSTEELHAQAVKQEKTAKDSAAQRVRAGAPNLREDEYQQKKDAMEDQHKAYEKAFRDELGRACHRRQKPAVPRQSDHGRSGTRGLRPVAACDRLSRPR